MSKQNHTWSAFTFRSVIDYRKNGIQQPGSSVVTRAFGTDQLTGTNNPNFRIQIANKQDATSNYIRRRVTKLTPLAASGIIDVVDNTNDIYTGNLFFIPSLFAGPVDYTASVPSAMVGYRDRALRSVKNKLGTKEVRFQSLIPAAELRDMHTTYQGMCNTTSSFLKGIINFKRGLKNPKQALANLIDFSSNAWLTYSFGIAPTMSDFQGLADAVIERATARSRTIKEVGGCSTTFSGAFREQSTYLGGNFATPTTSTVSVQTRGAYVYDLLYLFGAGRFLNFESANGPTSANAQFQTSILDVIPAAYELIPYSWLLDYFTTAGDVINDVFESPYGTSIYNYETRVSKWSINSSSSVIPKSKASGGSVTQQFTAAGIDIRRLKLTNLPHQSLRIKMFDEISVNAGNRLRNLFSLAAPIVVRPLRRS